MIDIIEPTEVPILAALGEMVPGPPADWLNDELVPPKAWEIVEERDPDGLCILYLRGPWGNLTAAGQGQGIAFSALRRAAVNIWGDEFGAWLDEARAEWREIP